MWVDCLFYLYGSEQEAEAGSRGGGTGFLVHYPSATAGYGHLYAVTNKHVIDEGFCVLRLNRKAGGTDRIPTQPEQWIPHPDGDDLMVFPLDIGEGFKWWSISTGQFVTHEIIGDYNIGYGDEVFLVGRLVVHAGKRENKPIIRFGNIVLMADPSELLEFRNSKGDLVKQEAFLVECHSLSGFSGSPVLVTTTQGYHDEAAQRVVKARQKEMGYTPPAGEERSYKMTTVSFFGCLGPWLLGVDFGHLPVWQDVYKKDEKTKADFKVNANTGIAGVIPAWRILNILEDKKLKTLRAKDERKIAKLADNRTLVVLDSSVPENDEFTQQDFDSALRKATRRVEPSQSGKGKK
jgi:hypothetical protein